MVLLVCLIQLQTLKHVPIMKKARVCFICAQQLCNQVSVLYDHGIVSNLAALPHMYVLRHYEQQNSVTFVLQSHLVWCRVERPLVVSSDVSQ